MTYNICLFSAVPYEKQYYASKSWGVYRVASELRSRQQTCQVINFFNRFDDNDIIKILNKIISADTRILGFSTSFWDQFKDDDKKNVLKKAQLIISYIRKNYPKIKIIAGGHSYKLLIPYDIDAAFEGFSENDFIPYIIDNLERTYSVVENVKVFKNIQGNFNFNLSQTIYQKNDIVNQHDTPILEVGRGCIFNCKFCAFSLNGKKKFDYIKDPDVLRQELLYNYENFGIQYYMLSDDTFNDSTYKLKLLSEVFKSLPFKIKFNCYLRLDLLRAHPEQITLLKEMGLVGAFFGVETFHDEAAKLIGKGIKGDNAKKLLHDLKYIHWGNDVKLSVGIISGIPYQTYDSYQQTIDWILDPKNLVEQVSPNPLYVSNPAYDPPENWEAEFRKNAPKYGFYWPTDEIWEWNNDTGDIKSFSGARNMHQQMVKAVTESRRWRFGGFNFLKNYTATQYVDNAPSIDQFLEMDRFTYNDWIEQNLDDKVDLKCFNLYKEELWKVLDAN